MKKCLSILLVMILTVTAAVPALSAAAADVGDIITGTFTYMPAFVDEPAAETFYYSDSWLCAPSNEQNTHLTTMSMALAFASMEIEGSSYITDLYEKIGFEDIETDDMNDTPASNTIGTAIAHKKIDGRDVIAVSIRGNKYGAEWASNLLAGAQGNIEGFEQAAQKALGRIKAYIADHGLSSVKLWIAGYSRGGAAADLAGVYINEHLDEFDTAASDLFVYCFEAPLCCVSDTVYPNIYCVKNKNDLITLVYPASWGLYTNGVEIVTGEDMTVNKAKVDLLGVEKIVLAGSVPMDAFNADLIDFLSDELTREKFSGDFDGAVSGLIDLYFSKAPDTWNAVFNSLKGSLSNVTSNTRAIYIVFEEVQSGIMRHNSDAMYRQLADELKILLQEIAPADQLPLTAEEYQEILDSIYPLIRAIGPVLVKDYYYKEGIDYSTALPADYSDPDFDPQTAEKKILTYDQFMEAEKNKPTEPEYVPTDAEQGEDDGIGAGYDRGYADGLAGNEPITEAPLPEDAENRSKEYLDAYQKAYLNGYESGYEDAVKEENPQHSEDYNRGVDNADNQVAADAKKDALTQSYRASYNEEPVPKEDGTPYSQDYLEGYHSRYRNFYDGYYQVYTDYYKELTLYHLVTLYVNREAILSQHYPQTNWALVKARDSFYNAEPTDSVLLGDVDCDGFVTVIDATRIQKYKASLISEKDINLSAADVDGDGFVTVIDATGIQKWRASLPAPEGIGKPIS